MCISFEDLESQKDSHTTLCELPPDHFNQLIEKMECLWKGSTDECSIYE